MPILTAPAQSWAGGPISDIQNPRQSERPSVQTGKVACATLYERLDERRDFLNGLEVDRLAPAHRARADDHQGVALLTSPA
jgi:hypothetical protein